MIRDYLFYRRVLFRFFALSLILSSTFWWLLDNSTADLLYAALIVTILFLLIIIWDFCNFARKVKHLKAISESLYFAELDTFSDNDVMEQYYHKIIEHLLERLQQNTEQAELTHQRELHYFTMWAHQIKSPIFAMNLTLKSLPQTPPELTAQLFEIERYSDMALQYVRSKKMSDDLVIRPCHVEDVVKQCVKRFAPMFIQKKLSIDIAPIQAVVMTDGKWLQFALEQILSNAVKYTDDGGVSIRFDKGCLIVQDTGIGIHPEDIPRVFEHGYTGLNGRLNSRSSGIGLYMAKHILNQLHIDIAIESKPTSGTKVILRFPKEDEIIFE